MIIYILHFPRLPFLQVREEENDTRVLSTLLQTCQDEQEICDVIARVQGPWALVYWQVRQ